MLSPKDYDYIWTDYEVNFIFTSCYLFKSFKKTDFVLIYDYKEKGLKFFLSKKARARMSSQIFDFYKKDFINWKKEIAQNIVRGKQLIEETKKHQSAEMSNAELKKHFIARVKLFQDLGDNYFYTEFFWLDNAEELAKNKIIKKRLQETGKIKFKARKVLTEFYNFNKIFASYIQEMAKRTNRKDLEWLSPQDIIKVFNNKKVPKSYLNKTDWTLAKKNKWKVTKDKKTIHKFNQHFFPQQVKEFKGMVANKGVVKGKVRILKTLFSDNMVKQLKKVKSGDIIVAETTGPDMMPALVKAAAIVTDEGGITSHAAIVSRELKVPCVIATKIASRSLKDGDLVEVDANKGIVKKI